MKKKHGDDETKGYLDKVFDLQFPIPEPRAQDIADMAYRMLSKKETPKLEAAFKSLAQYLPSNPREAAHFLNDAKAKETFFSTATSMTSMILEAFFCSGCLSLKRLKSPIKFVRNT